MLYHKHNYGYTLIELVIAMAIGTILIAAASATYVAQNRSYVAEESISETNTQSKIAQDLLVNDMRSAGFGVPTDMNIDPINGFTTIATPVDSAVNSDAITVVGGFRMVGTLWPPGVNPGSPCPAVVPLGTQQVRIINNGIEGPNMTDNRFISIDGINFATIQNCTILGGICDSNTLTIDRPLSQNFPVVDIDGDGLCDSGRPVYVVEDATFCVDNNAVLRRIRRNAIPGACASIATSDDDAIAENIEDLQLAYAVDFNNDGQIDDQNGSGTVDAGDFINGGLVINPATIRAVRINILARTDKPDPNYQGLGSPPVAIENRAHAQVPDNFKRRWWQSMITMRNQ
jgi:prepilin-type N-terminal cleavage/methylation domain-containing protein